MSGRLSSRTCHLRAPKVIHLQHRALLPRQPPGGLPASGRAAAQAGGGAAEQRLHVLAAAARRGRQQEFDADYVAFDDEEDWEQTGTPVQSGLGPLLSTSLRGLAMITDKLTDVALQFAPEDASPGVVRVAVSAGLVLLALSFVKSLLSFFLTLGTIILGAYVAVRVFGVDVAGVTGSMNGGDLGSSSGGRGRAPRRAKQQQRRPDPRAPQSEFKGLLGGPSSRDEDGLLDVWFERKGTGSGSSSGGKDRRRR